MVLHTFVEVFAHHTPYSTQAQIRGRRVHPWCIDTAQHTIQTKQPRESKQKSMADLSKSLRLFCIDSQNVVPCSSKVSKRIRGQFPERFPFPQRTIRTTGSTFGGGALSSPHLLMGKSMSTVYRHSCLFLKHIDPCVVSNTA